MITAILKEVEFDSNVHLTEYEAPQSPKAIALPPQTALIKDVDPFTFRQQYQQQLETQESVKEPVSEISFMDK